MKENLVLTAYHTIETQGEYGDRNLTALFFDLSTGSLEHW